MSKMWNKLIKMNKLICIPCRITVLKTWPCKVVLNNCIKRGYCSAEGYEAQSRSGHSSRIDCDQSYYYDKSGHEDNDDFTNVKEQILKAALKLVHEHGWSRNALRNAVKEMGLPATAHGMFQRGSGDLILYFYFKANSDLAQQMAEYQRKVEKDELEKKRTSEFIRDALKMRLQMLLPYKNTWPQAMAQMALPQNAPDALRNLGTLVDDIWYYSGDRSTDFSWYSKRMTLAAVYKSTELYLLQDSSEDFTETWQFLDRRLNQLSTFGQNSSKMIQSTKSLGDIIVGAAILGRNLVGLNSRKP